MSELADLKANAEGLLGVGRVDRAAEVVANGLATAPDDSDLLFLAVRIRLKTGNPRGALALAERLLQVDPSDPRSHWIYALSVCAVWPLRPGKIRAMAMPAVVEARRLAPTSAEAHYYYAYCRLQSAWPLWLQHYVLDDARQSALEAAHRSPRWVAPVLLLSDIERLAFNRAKAAEYAEVALRMDPTDSEVLLAAIDVSRSSARRLLVRRLAAVHPSQAATDLVLKTHRPMPTPARLLGVVLIALTVVVADKINYGEILPGPVALWVVGPLAGIWLTGLGLAWRRRSLLDFDAEVRTVIFDAERFMRWPRRALLAYGFLLPVLWWPASVIGAHPTAWAVAWLFGGVVTVLTLRPRFGL